MGVFSFLKTAGSKLFGGNESPEERGQKVKDHLQKQGLDVSNVNVTEDGNGVVTLTGQVKDFPAKQRILATAGNVEGVESVQDDLTLAEPLEISVNEVATFYEVKSGDSLSKISSEVYGDPNKYTVIFEANKPMLSHPDKIYPGQMLFIPPQG